MAIKHAFTADSDVSSSSNQAIRKFHGDSVNLMDAIDGKFISLPRQVSDALDTIDAVLAIGDSLMDDPAGTSRTLTRYLAQVRRIQAAARSVEAIGLHCLCTRFEKNLVTLLGSGKLLSADEQQMLRKWPNLVRQYESQGNINPALTDLIAAPAWQAQLRQKEADTLSASLVRRPVAAVKHA